MTNEVPKSRALVKRPSEEIEQGIDSFTVQLTGFLDTLGLPSDRVLVVTEERRKVIFNLPGVLGLLTAEARREATYISKFVAACAVQSSSRVGTP
jgi:hypothetical protein